MVSQRVYTTYRLNNNNLFALSCITLIQRPCYVPSLPQCNIYALSLVPDMNASSSRPYSYCSICLGSLFPMSLPANFRSSFKVQNRCQLFFEACLPCPFHIKLFGSSSPQTCVAQVFIVILIMLHYTFNFA